MMRNEVVEIMKAALMAQADYVSDGFDNEMLIGAWEDISGEFGEEIADFWNDCMLYANEVISDWEEAEYADIDQLAEEMVDEDGEIGGHVPEVVTPTRMAMRKGLLGIAAA